jgi:hypothetical protein
LQERLDIEALLQDRHPLLAACGRDAELAHPGQERVLVAGGPDAERVARKIPGLLDARVPAAGEHHAGPIEDLGDVDQGHALLACRQRRRHPFHDHIGAAARDHLRRCDVGPARHDGDVEADLVIKSLLFGDIVAGELRLRDPFELQGQLVRRRGETAAEQQHRSRSERPYLCAHRPFPSHVSSPTAVHPARTRDAGPDVTLSRQRLARQCDQDGKVSGTLGCDGSFSCALQEAGKGDG